MECYQMSNKQARQFLLEYHGLGVNPQYEGEAGILQYIRQVNCIQFDPLNIVGRNAELVLQSRIPEFRPAMLDKLLYIDRALLDGWDKVMSIYPQEDWPYFHRFRNQALVRYGSVTQIQNILPDIRERFINSGPLSSKDLNYNESIDWAWAPTRLSRAVLESMYLWGELIVHHKRNNQKVYDLATKYLPPSLLHIEEPHVDDESYYRFRVKRRIGGVGLLWNKPSDAWVGLTELKAKDRQLYFQTLHQSGDITEVHVQGVETPLYARTEDFTRIIERISTQQDETSKRSFIIAPLDNLLWDRKLIQTLFGFQYTWEVYKPVEKRDFGYYVLPVLYGDVFVARFEPGRDPVTRNFYIKNWWWEVGVIPDPAMMTSLLQCFQRFSTYLDVTADQMHLLLAEVETILANA